MASIKSILAAVNNVKVIDRRVTTNHHHGVKISGWFRSAGFDVVEVLDLLLTGRLGCVSATVTTTTSHTHSHSIDGSVMVTVEAEPVWDLQSSHEGVTVETLRQTLSSLGCQILE